MPKAHLFKKYSLNHKGEGDKALASCNNAVRLHPKDADAYVNRGVARGNLSRFYEAFEDFNIAIELNPKCTAAYFNRGKASFEKAEYGKDWFENDEDRHIEFDKAEYNNAIVDYGIAIQLNPKYAKAFNNRGVASS